MLDIQFIRENPSLVQKAALNKGVDINIDHVLEIDSKRKELQKIVQHLQEERNALTKNIVGKPSDEQIKKGREVREKIDKNESAFRAVEEELKDWLLKVPNIAAKDVPIGKDEKGNVEVRKVGEKTKFAFTPKTHEELAEQLDLLDNKRAVGIAGSRAYILKGDLVLLEQAVLNFSLDFMVLQGFTPMTVPWMVNKEALWGTGYFPWGIEDHYTTQDGQGLIGTSEVVLTAYHQGETLLEKDLPVKIVGISPCFRREVGSYGKDTKGFFRVHQFNKVEQMVLTVADEEETRLWHEKMVGFAEHVLKELKLSFRVMLMCTGDMGAGQRKKYDIETWFPGQNAYRETHSASYFNDFQSRRLNIRYKTKTGETKFVYTLNNTVAATPRLLAAIIENYQQKDGSIAIPNILQKYMNGKKIISSKK